MKRDFPDSDSAYRGLANMYSTLRKTKDAIYELQQALIHFPNNTQIAYQLINSLLGYNEPEEALNIFNRYIPNPTSISNQLLMAHIIKIKDGNGAYLNALETLYEQYPDIISVALAYANALINLTMEDV